MIYVRTLFHPQPERFVLYVLFVLAFLVAVTTVPWYISIGWYVVAAKFYITCGLITAKFVWTIGQDIRKAVQ